MAAMPAPGAHHAATMQDIDRVFGAGWDFDR